MSLDLPATGTEQAPAFLTADACRGWLAKLPATNATQAQSMLLGQLNLLHRYTLPAAMRFAIFETLLAPVSDAQEEVLKKFVGRALPLAPPEQAALDGSLAIWQAMAQGYLRCFDACRTGDAGLVAQTATVAERTFSLFADWQVTLCRGGQLPEPSYWAALNQVFAVVEQKKLATTAVHDPVRHGSTPTRPLAAYAECHLLYSASPFELPARHLTWVARWARRWGIKVELLTAPPDDIRTRAVPLWIDLQADQPTSYQPRPTPGGRWLDTTELRKSLTARIGLLDQGRAPADLQLGDDVTQPTASQVLNRVLVRWCKGGAPRRQERRVAGGGCQLVAGMEPAHLQLSGGIVTHKQSLDDAALRREQEKYLMFGTRGHRDAVAPLAGVSTERWEVGDDWRLLDESATGVRLTRPLKDGARIAPGTLVAIKTLGAENFMLGNARWVLRESNQSLALGVQLFAGTPRFASVRPIDSPGVTGSFKPGFLLSATAAATLSASEPASLLTPVGTFRIGRTMEVLAGDTSIKVKLAQLLDRGNDFERCTYQMAEAATN